MRSWRPPTTLCTTISGAPSRREAASRCRDFTAKTTEAKHMTKRQNTAANDRFLPFLLTKEERAKSSRANWTLIDLKATEPLIFFLEQRSLLNSWRNNYDRSRGKVLQCRWMSLKGRMEVGECRVSRVTGLGCEAKIREPVAPSHRSQFCNIYQSLFSENRRMDQD